MRRRSGTILLAVLLSLAATFVLPMSVFAVGGIGLTPAIREVTLQESDQEARFSVAITNSTEHVAELRVSALDFGALDESGGVAFLGRTGQETSSYGLSKWMTIEKDVFRLEPGQSEDVWVRVENQESLSPGGHYGAVVVAASQNSQGNSDSVVMLPAASTLVLLKKYGGEKIDLQLDSIKANKSLMSLPNSVSLRFYNAGNMHAVPRGTVRLRGPFNQDISRGVINESSSFVLPETHRQYNTDLVSKSRPWLPGRYTMDITWRYDGTDQTTTSTYHYWYLGTLGIIAIILVCLLIVLYLYIIYRRRPLTRN